MCRNIKTLFNFDPPVTPEEIKNASLQFVRKISGFHKPSKANEAAFQAAEPGVGRSAALWLYEHGMSVLGTDTTGTEPLPFDDPAVTTHGAMLVEKGVHLIENLYLEDVARDGVREGLFIALPLKITGATGSWIRPILVV